MPDQEHRDAFDTRAVHAGAEPDELTGAVSPPIYQTSTYAQDGVGRPRRGYEYARTQNPTRERLERAVADLEGGAHGIAFASGSATTAAIAQLAAAGEEILVGDDVYGGTFRYFERVHRPAGAGEARYVDLAGHPDALWEGLNERTRLVWLETPSNPLLKVTDIAAAAAILTERAAQAGGARPLLVIDNTFASPALQRPLELGADVVFHSATKYLGGHSDTVVGVAVTNDDEVADRLRFLQNAMGGVPGPFDCFLVLRGLRTLPLRMARHSANGLAVARFLASRAGRRVGQLPGPRPPRRRPRTSPAPRSRPPDAAPGRDAGVRRDGVVRAGARRRARAVGRGARDRHLRGRPACSRSRSRSAASSP